MEHFCILFISYYFFLAEIIHKLNLFSNSLKKNYIKFFTRQDNANAISLMRIMYYPFITYYVCTDMQTDSRRLLPSAAQLEGLACPIPLWGFNKQILFLRLVFAVPCRHPLREAICMASDYSALPLHPVIHS